MTAATRGKILDRNGQALATNGNVTQAGLVPGKLGTGDERTANQAKIATAWDVKTSSLETLLKQSWVTDDTFVPVKIVTDSPALTGAAYQTIGSRTYPLGEAAAQLVGYVGTATADDLKKHPSLTANSKIGKAGLEQIMTITCAVRMAARSRFATAATAIPLRHQSNCRQEPEADN